MKSDQIEPAEVPKVIADFLEAVKTVERKKVKALGIGE